MAKIKTLDYWILRTHHQVAVKFCEGGRRKGPPSGFSIELPADMRLAFDQQFVAAPTIDKCVDDFKALVEKFEKADLKRERVIVYNFEASKRPKSKEAIAKERKERASYDRGPIEKEIDDFEDRNERAVRGLKISWEVAERVVYADEVEFQRLKTGEKIYMENDNGWMPWTAEREEFFKQLDVALDALVLRAASLLDHDGDRFAVLIDSKAALPAIGYEPKKEAVA
jgi:hypothetical protein